MKRFKSGYQDIISDATGVTDQAHIDLIEDVMRHDIFHSTLDWQTRGQLEDAARLAKSWLPELLKQGAALTAQGVEP